MNELLMVIETNLQKDYKGIKLQFNHAVKFITENFSIFCSSIFTPISELKPGNLQQ